MNRICAGVVLYEPDIELLRQNVTAISSQVQAVIVVDNASSNADAARGVFEAEFVTWVSNASNVGIAKALNQVMDEAAQLGFDWVVTLDQDSVSDASMVANMMPAMADDVIMVAPRVIDKAFADTGAAGDQLPDFEDIDRCITSGALTQVAAVKAIGGFDERLFVDQVDNEICLRAGERGYRVVQANRALLYQRYGENGVRRRFLWRMVSYHEYSPDRVYYQQRNLIYVCRKYGKRYVPHPMFFALVRQPAAFFVKLLFMPGQRLLRLKKFRRGFVDGWRLSTKVFGG